MISGFRLPDPSWPNAKTRLCRVHFGQAHGPFALSFAVVALRSCPASPCRPSPSLPFLQFNLQAIMIRIAHVLCVSSPYFVVADVPLSRL